jgi:hypothetical protein
MKTAWIVALCLIAPSAARAADKAAPPDTAKMVPMTMKEVKQKLGMVVFPAKGQKPEQQDDDEYECLKWGAEEAGVKPTDPAPDKKAAGDAAAAKVDSAATGAAVKGAAKGAAAGAMMGAIWGDAGAGAATGAIGGALAGRRAKKQAKANAKAQAEQQVDAQQKARIDAVKKGMTACLQAKGYTVQ